MKMIMNDMPKSLETQEINKHVQINLLYKALNTRA